MQTKVDQIKTHSCIYNASSAQPKTYNTSQLMITSSLTLIYEVFEFHDL